MSCRLLCVLISSAIISLTQARVVQPSSLNPRQDSCHSGEPGAVRIGHIMPRKTDSAEESYEHDYSAQDASGCLTEFYLRDNSGGMRNSVILKHISPNSGGYCMVYSTEDCADGSVMQLDNPLHLNLLYPDKIVCPGVESTMVPNDFQAIKCFNHDP